MAMLLVLSLANLEQQAVVSVPSDGATYRTHHDGLALESGSGDLAGVPLGARLLAIDEHVVRSRADVASEIEKHGIGDVLTYRFQVGESQLSARVTLVPRPSEAPRRLALFALALLFWGACLRSLLLGPVPAGFVGFHASAFAVLAFSPTGRADLLDAAFFGIDSLGRLYLGPTALLLAIALGRATALPARQVAMLLFGVPVAVALAAAALYAGGADLVWLLSTADQKLLGLAAALIVAAAAHLGRRLATARVSADVRDRMRWGLVAFLFGALPFALTTLLPLALHPRFETVGVAGAAFLAIVPLTLPRALRSSERALVRRTARALAATSASAAAVGVLAAALLVGLARWIEPADALVWFVGIFAISILSAIPFAGRVDAWLQGRALGARAPLQRTLAAFGEELLPLREPVAIARHAAIRVAEAFDLRGASVHFGDGPLATYGEAVAIAAVRERTRESGLEVARLDAVVDGMTEPALSITLPRPAGEMKLVLSPRRDGEELDRADVSRIVGFAHLLFRALENAALFAALEDRARALDRLSQENVRVIEASAAGIVVAAADGTIKVVNEAMLAILGSSRAEIVGRPVDAGLPAELHGIVEGRRKVVWGGRTKVLDVQWSELPDGGRLLTVHDATLQARLEETLQERERLLQLGMMAAQVAHEVATPLTGVSSYAQMLEGRVADPAGKDMVRRIQEQAARASDIARGVLKLARTGAEAAGPEAVDVVRVAEDLVDLLRPLCAESGVRLAVTATADARGTHRLGGTRGQLEQILVNLLLNARDATPRGGVVDLRVSREGEGLLLEVRDRGAGIPPEIVERIFDPFYTTKPTGTGLGLYVARRMAAALGGTLKVESEAGQGTRMMVSIPLQDARL